MGIFRTYTFSAKITFATRSEAFENSFHISWEIFLIEFTTKRNFPVSTMRKFFAKNFSLRELRRRVFCKIFLPRMSGWMVLVICLLKFDGKPPNRKKSKYEEKIFNVVLNDCNDVTGLIISTEFTPYRFFSKILLSKLAKFFQNVPSSNQHFKKMVKKCLKSSNSQSTIFSIKKKITTYNSYSSYTPKPYH